MTLEQIMISLTFAFLLGTQVGRALTLRNQARKIVEAVNCMAQSKWLGPSILAARIHQDQEAVEALPSPTGIWSPPKRMPIWLELQYEFCRWRAPRLRRVK